MTAQTHKILSRHTKLSEAVAAANIDLSYNEPLARADLARNDRDAAIAESFVVNNSSSGRVEVWFRYDCDIKLLNKYSPFSACLHDGAFSKVEITDSEITIFNSMLSRSRAARKLIAQLGWVVAAL